MKTNFAVSSDGAKIAYNVFGKGPALLLVHGMGANKEMWVDNGWVNIFEKYFTVITIDIRGNGESDKSYNSNFYSIDNIMNDINIVALEYGFSEFNYFGHSYGATIGLQVCRHNKNIKKAVCAGTIFGDKFFKETVPEWINEYELINLKKKSNQLDELNLSNEEAKWAKKTDFDLTIAELKAWKSWTGVEVNDIKTNLAVYTGTDDNAQVLENLVAKENQMLQNHIAFRIFENLNHSDLVSKTNIVSPWVLNFLLKQR